MEISNIDLERVNVLIDLALTEDLSDVGDTTSKSVIPEDTKAVAVLRCKEDLVCAGLPVAEHVFKKVCPADLLQLHPRMPGCGILSIQLRAVRCLN